MIRRRAELDRDRALLRSRHRARSAGIGPNLMGKWWGSTALCSCAGWDVTDLPLEALWQADYSGSPWVGTASAGDSGGRDLTNGVYTAWTVGTAQNGYDPAYGNGLSAVDAAPAPEMQMRADGNWSDYTGAYAFSGWVVAKPEAAASMLWAQCDFNFPLLFYWNDTPATVTFHLKAANGTNVACSRTGGASDTYGLFTFRYDGAHVQVGVNEYPGRQPVANAPHTEPVDTTGGGNLRCGLNATIDSEVFLGDILEIGIGPTSRVLTDLEFCKIRCRARAKYDLPLVEPAL